MGKYIDLQNDLFSLFNGASWKAENIKTYPNNFVAVNSSNEFIRMTAIPNGEGLNLNSSSGILNIEIFTSAGNGPKRASIIADKLDDYLVGKSLSTVQNNVTQFMNSAMDHLGPDEDNSALHRSIYSIPFNHFGVL
jgi:hypothetical protein